MLCDQLARRTAHAALAGESDIVIGNTHGMFIHVPIEPLPAANMSSCPATKRGEFAVLRQKTRKQPAGAIVLYVAYEEKASIKEHCSKLVV
jgi:hypothetical protein